ncbi:hypothetical protein [Streptococcus suis]|uniref:hypothetical protein n=1 Tax=Streptococcus suis TaxID=1307 RepID=UPI001960C567|nr:hypothetical protein [Streptococcus suis]MBM7283285.1 hypothetical protein [Streptococcus suis]MCO8237433.1 hypothetical protein [Streptococcus suis]HEM3531939.1 hypothetical protein [Streptococcus suis]
MKLYSTEIKNWTNIVIFEEIRENWTESDEYGVWFTTNQADFDWWNQLANAIEFINVNDIDVDVNELADYIAIAKENGFEG